MITYACDRCGVTIQTSRDIAARHPYNGYEVNPGYIGKQILCGSCWKLWGEVLKTFFTSKEN